MPIPHMSRNIDDQSLIHLLTIAARQVRTGNQLAVIFATDTTVPGTEDLLEIVLDALGLPSEPGARDLCYDLFYLEHCKNGQLKPAELLSALRQIAQDMTR